MTIYFISIILLSICKYTFNTTAQLFHKVTHFLIWLPLSVSLHPSRHSMMCQFGVVESKSTTFPAKEKARHLLDDSFLESHSPVRNHTHDSVFTNGISLGTAVYSYCTHLSLCSTNTGLVQGFMCPNVGVFHHYHHQILLLFWICVCLWFFTTRWEWCSRFCAVGFCLLKT